MPNESDRELDALSVLDQRALTGFYWRLALLATIGGFLFGYDTANIGAALNFIPYRLGDFALGYLVAGTSVGAAAGALLAGPLTDRFGRKSLLIADAGIYMAGAVLAAVSWHEWVLLIARTLVGLAIGADSAIATAYIAEYAPQDRRGALSMLQQWMITVGILVSYLVALVILTTMPDKAYDLDWRLIFGLGALPAAIGFALRTRMPESPRWLLEKSRYRDVQRALNRLGIHVTMNQVERSAELAAEQQRRDAGKQQVSPWSAGVKRALVMVCVFFIFQQISGINVPLYYGPRILAPLFEASDSVLDSAIAGVQVTVIMSAVNVAATYFAFRYIDRLGRRKLSMSGFAGMAVSALVAASGLAIFAGTAEIVVVMIGLNLFISFFAIGVGGTGWLIQGESFPTAVRGRAAAVAAAVNWLANFAVVQAFPVWQRAIGLAWVFACFAALCLFAIAFIGRFLPETKRLSVDEIVDVYERKALR
ncbi:sugar porter family MFS transporter [Streptomyces marianii]|uniref:Sugar porter family MFS transporter n=1 Tax=Streptomyces marianii TaxID=1817406 RepID=A0A5R9E421_9ACTN|nr:sugar porter family MFS transporter [Streptomyces marianii]TLQ44067.1 sugar porter family MFS transporter [Streptomyces marianii]